MPNTQNSFEYQILKYLNDKIETYNIWEDDLKKRFISEDRLFTNDDFVEYFPKLIAKGFIGNKTSNDHPKGLSITDQGKIRYSQLKEHITAIDRIYSLEKQSEKNTEATKSLTRWVSIATIVGGIAAVIQLFLSYHSNTISSCQLELNKGQSKLPIQNIQPSNTNSIPPTIQINVNGNKISCDSLNR